MLTKNLVNAYPQLTIWRDGKQVTRTVHSLVADTFLGPPPPGAWIRHLDDDKLNSALDNLLYGSPKENGQDNVRNGKSLTGEKNHACKLNEADVKYIRRSKATATALAVEFCVSISTVSNIRTGKTWSHVK